MTKKHISFPSIEKFSNIVTNINRENNFVGLDENGEAIYDPSKLKPVLKFIGSVKLHGTNFGICWNQTDGIWVQSRENIITPQSDNAGAAFFVESKKEVFEELFAQVIDKTIPYVDPNENTISIYGEWCGANIQKGVGITNLPKSLFIFGVKISPHNINETEKPPVAYWVDHSYLRNPENKIYNINDYKVFEIDIDFNVPQLVQNQLINWTLEVEDECPVAKAFGFGNTIGEGIVFTYITPEGKRYSFKSKGTKHSNSKVRTLKQVDDAKINNCINIANSVCTSWRLEQIFNQTFDTLNGGQADIKRMGEFLKAVMADVIKEETDVIADAGLEPKDIGKYVSEITKTYFFEQNKLA